MRSKSLASSFQAAFAGVWHVCRTQRNARIHVAAAAIALVAGVATRLSSAEWSILALAIGGVFAAELINTAIESLVDLVSPEYHERAKIAKDAAAGAVLVAALVAVGVGCAIFGPPLWRWILG